MASSSKELKARLKAAKAAVGKKDFQEVYKLCQVEYISSLRMCANLKWALFRHQSPPAICQVRSGALIPYCDGYTNTKTLVANK